MDDSNVSEEENFTASNICSHIHLKDKLDNIKQCTLWNSFLKSVTRKVIKQVIKKTNIDQFTSDPDLKLLSDFDYHVAEIGVFKKSKDTSIKFRLCYDN